MSQSPRSACLYSLTHGAECGQPITETQKNKKKRCLQCGVAGYSSLVLKQSSVDIMDGGQGRGDGGRWLHHQGLFDVYSRHQRQQTKLENSDHESMSAYSCTRMGWRQRDGGHDTAKQSFKGGRGESYLFSVLINPLIL